MLSHIVHLGKMVRNYPFKTLELSFTNGEYLYGSLPSSLDYIYDQRLRYVVRGKVDNITKLPYSF